MPDPRNVYSVGISLLAWFVLLLCVGNAAAYVGPGAGLELVGYSLSLLGWVVAAFSALLLWPVYGFCRWLRNGKREPHVIIDGRTVAEGEGACIPLH